MQNNDVLRRLRYIFDYDDMQMQEIFKLGKMVISTKLISNWLKREEDDGFLYQEDYEMASFLNGLIIKHRGQKEGKEPIVEEQIDNNIMLRKLKIALNYKDTDMIEIFSFSDKIISKHELSAFFRKPGHKNYRVCQDQVFRNFLKGLQIKFRGQ